VPAGPLLVLLEPLPPDDPVADAPAPGVPLGEADAGGGGGVDGWATRSLSSVAASRETF
jgi:hypothetical protein